MRHEQDAFELALEVGRKLMLQAQGDPARTLAYGVTAIIAMTGVAIGYGAFSHAQKTYRRMKENKT